MALRRPAPLFLDDLATVSHSRPSVRKKPWLMRVFLSFTGRGTRQEGAMNMKEWKSHENLRESAYEARESPNTHLMILGLGWTQRSLLVIFPQ